MLKETKPLYKVGDKVRILDGSKIKDYTGRWYSTMAICIGKTATIKGIQWCGSQYGYRLNLSRRGGGFVWDERGLEPASNEAIVIYRKDREVIALDKRTGQTAKACCNPSDEFNFETGAKLAFNRLIPSVEPSRTEPDKSAIKVGDIVKVINTGLGCPTYADWVIRNVPDIKDIARFAYNNDMGYSEGIMSLPDTFIVLAVAENRAYISRSKFSAPCHLFNLDGLEKY